jgi:uncharacterized protein (DUF1015 family)
MRSWFREGVLFTEANPAIYVYHQAFTEGGVTITRRGFMSRVRLEPFGEGSIYPHEETHGGPKADRIKLWRACRANLSPIFGIYPDEQNAAQNLLEAAVAGTAPLEATDHLGVVHRLWPVIDVRLITEVIAAMSDRPVYIADGHHRYETALTLRDELAVARGGELPGNHPANFVLMACVSTSDPGMIVLPTHRLFRGLKPISSDQLRHRLGDLFACNAAGRGAERGPALWEEMEIEAEQGVISLYTAADDAWTVARITAAGRTRLAEIAPEHSADWRNLGVSILHRLLIDELLDGAGLPAPKYVRDIDEFVGSLQAGDATGRDATGQAGTGGRFELAALVMPATVEHIRSISGHGERMPAKSTYFYPKLLSGLVINPLE